MFASSLGKVECHLINNHGFSFVETILTVSILCLLFGTLLPLTNQMMVHLAEKKTSMYVALTKNEAATSIMNGHLDGVVVLDGQHYSWVWNQSILCVEYEFLGNRTESCDAF